MRGFIKVTDREVLDHSMYGIYFPEHICLVNIDQITAICGNTIYLSSDPKDPRSRNYIQCSESPMVIAEKIEKAQQGKAQHDSMVPIRETTADLEKLIKLFENSLVIGSDVHLNEADKQAIIDALEMQIQRRLTQ